MYYYSYNNPDALGMETGRTEMSTVEPNDGSAGDGENTYGLGVHPAVGLIK